MPSVISKLQMLHVQKKLAFQPGDGCLPHAPELWTGHCQGQAFPSELQEVHRSSNGEAQRHHREH